MAQPSPAPVAEADDHSGEFDRLRRFVLYHLGRFTLGLVRVNDPQQRNNFIASLTDALRADGVQLIRVDLGNRHPANLRAAVLAELPDLQSLISNSPASNSRPDSNLPPGSNLSPALALIGMEHLIEAEPGPSGRPPFAAALNLERDALHASLPLPLLLFLTDHAMDRLDLAAPDFFDWYTSVFRLRGATVVAPSDPTSQKVAEPRADYARADFAPSPLTPATRAARLDLLEERRAELAEMGPTARPRLAQVLKEMGEEYAALPEIHHRGPAVACFKQASEIFHEAGDKATEAEVLERLGEVCYWIGDYQQAVRRYEAALPIYRDIGHRLGEANCIRSLGDVHVQLAEYPLARQRFEAALPIYRDIGDRLGEANTLYGLFQVEKGLVHLGSAADFAEKALALYGDIGTLHHPTAQHAKRWLEENREQIKEERHAAEAQLRRQLLAQPYSPLIHAVVTYCRGDRSRQADLQSQLNDLRLRVEKRDLADALEAIAFRGKRFEKRLTAYMEHDDDRAVIHEILHRLEEKASVSTST